MVKFVYALRLGMILSAGCVASAQSGLPDLSEARAQAAMPVAPLPAITQTSILVPPGVSQVSAIALPSMAKLAGDLSVSNRASVGFSSSSSVAEIATAGSAGMLSARPVRPLRASTRLGASYFLVNGLHLGMGMFDIAMTQHCIAEHQCREGNPLMPSSLGGQLAVNFGYAAYSSFISYRLKKHHSALWWTSPAAGTAAHAVGVASGFAHR